MFVQFVKDKVFKNQDGTENKFQELTIIDDDSERVCVLRNYDLENVVFRSGDNVKLQAYINYKNMPAVKVVLAED